ncbi:MAG: glycosyltransferase family 4 protein [Actinobacteria bacterium]|nr:glycosyltransferase family 4 protein [Actinomycetota bacterium]
MTRASGPRPRPVRLLLVVDSLEMGGAERQVVDLAVALRRKGYEVVVACSVAGSLWGVLEEADIPVRPLLDRLAKRRFSVAYAWRLRRLLRSARFDLVHAHIYASVVAATIATSGTGVPLVITEHTEASWQTWRARWVSRWVYRRVERIIAVSTPIRRRLIERDGVHPDLITIVPNAVVSASETRSDQPPELPAGLRERPLVGVVSRLQPEKGVANFLKAAARVAPRFPEAHFVIAGDGPLRQELVALAEDLDLGSRVHFLGFRSDASALMGSLDVVVVPSLTEGSPLVTLEAMAAGVPVVASAVGGVPDQVRHDKEGLLVSPGDTEAMADALLDLLRNPARARSLGEAGRQRAASEFSHAAMVRRIEDVYRDVLGRPATRNVEEPELRTTR